MQGRGGIFPLQFYFPRTKAIKRQPHQKTAHTKLNDTERADTSPIRPQTTLLNQRKN